MARTIVFIHGAWVTPLCWEKFTGYFSGRGYNCITPAWPFRDQPVDVLRKNPPAGLARLGVTEIVSHYEKIIRSLDEPPFLIGHSFGGLFVQILLDRGVGRGGVALDSAPPKGVIPFQWSAIRSLAGVLTTWRGWERILHISQPTFQYAFVHTLSPQAQKEAYDRYVVPETGRIFFQGAVALLASKSAVRVDFQNPKRAPLLLIAGSQDHIVPAVQNRSNFAKYKNSPAHTDFKEFPGRTHWLIAQEGWEEVAAYCAAWLEQLPV